MREIAVTLGAGGKGGGGPFCLFKDNRFPDERLSNFFSETGMLRLETALALPYESL